MSTRTITIDDRLYDYMLAHSLREPEILRRLREETRAMPNGGMQISPEQGQFMQLLVKLTGARRYLEIGTFTGYSSLAVMLAMPADGEAVCCDVSDEFTQVARRYWQEAGVDGRVTLKIAPALETLDGLIADGRADSFDFCFVDADKETYCDYVDRAHLLLRQGGLLGVDNVLWGGDVADPEAKGHSLRGIRAVNEKLRDDERFDLSMLPIGDGLTLARKR